jgi:hypothetical protein
MTMRIDKARVDDIAAIIDEASLWIKGIGRFVGPDVQNHAIRNNHCGSDRKTGVGGVDFFSLVNNGICLILSV